MSLALLYSFIAAVVAFCVSSAAVPLVKRIAIAVRAVDYPGGRRDQAEAIPRLGGVAVFLGLCIGGGIATVLRWGVGKTNLTIAEMIAIPLAILIIFICGFLEDVVGLSAPTRILLQAAAGLVVMKVGFSFQVLYLPFIGDVKLGLFTGLISLVWIVGVTNAINLLDGLDGLAGGVVAIIASSLMVISLWQAEYVTVMCMAAVVGACIGFLRKNWAPAQIYLGDTGSLTLGFILAIVSINSSIKGSAAIAILVPILVLGLPVFDTILVMLFRFTRKTRGPVKKRVARMFLPDRSHLHHLMVRLAPSRSRIVIVIYSIALFFCALAFLVATSRNMNLGFVLLGLEVLVIFGMRQLGLHADALKISLEKRKEAREALLSMNNGKHTAAAK